MLELRAGEARPAGYAMVPTAYPDAIIAPDSSQICHGHRHGL
jgi:hypothetical protein